MQKVSEIISKEVISIYECESIGTIKNVSFSSNFKKIIAFVFFDDQSDFDSGVLSKDVYSFSGDGILIKNISKIEYHFDDEASPMNKKVFSLSGEDFGRINDILFDESFNVVNFLTSQDKTFKPSQIFKMGFDTCIIKQENDTVKINSFKPSSNTPKQTQLLDNITVKLVKLGEDTPLPVIEKNILPKLPIKLQANLESLIGKTSLKTITGLNNEIIIRQNAVVSKHTITMAKAHNKTAELMFSTNWRYPTLIKKAERLFFSRSVP